MIFNQEICCLCLKRKNPLHSILVKNNDTSYLIKLISFLPRLTREDILEHAMICCDCGANLEEVCEYQEQWYKNSQSYIDHILELNSEGNSHMDLGHIDTTLVTKEETELELSEYEDSHAENYLDTETENKKNDWRRCDNTENTNQLNTETDAVFVPEEIFIKSEYDNNNENHLPPVTIGDSYWLQYSEDSPPQTSASVFIKEEEHDKQVHENKEKISHPCSPTQTLNISKELTDISVRPFKCGKCDETFSDIRNLGKHVGTHKFEPEKIEDHQVVEKLKPKTNEQVNNLGLKPYKCGHCQKTFMECELFCMHVKTHNRILKWDEVIKKNNETDSIYDVMETFGMQDALTEAANINKDSNELIIKYKKTEKEFKPYKKKSHRKLLCDSCGLIFFDQNYYLRHLQTHKTDIFESGTTVKCNIFENEAEIVEKEFHIRKLPAKYDCENILYQTLTKHKRGHEKQVDDCSYEESEKGEIKKFK